MKLTGDLMEMLPTGVVEQAPQDEECVVAEFDLTLSTLFAGDNAIEIGEAYGFARTDAFSFSGWFKMDFSTGWGTLVSKRGAANGYALIWDEDNLCFVALFSGTSPSGSIWITYTPTDRLDAGWYNFVWTYDGSSLAAGMKLYLNGTELTPTVVTDTLAGDTTTVNPMVLGGAISASSTTYPWIGNLTNIAVWSDDLAQADVTELYNSGTPDDLDSHTKADVLASWWALGDGDTVAVLTDRVSCAHDGAMDGPTFAEDVPPSARYTITESPALSNGDIDYDPSRASYLTGTVVECTADPDEDYLFTGWSGGLSGTTNPADLTMDSNKTISAGFATVYEMTESIDFWYTGYVNFGAIYAFERTDPFSFALWIRPKSGSASPLNTAVPVFQEYSSNRGYRLLYTATTGTFQVILASSSSAKIDVSVTIASLAGSSDWIHVALCYSGSSAASGVKLYVNGALQNLTVNDDDLTTTMSGAGGLTISTSTGFVGRVCNISVFTKELSLAEVGLLYNDSIAPTGISNNASWWKLGDGDSTGAGNIVDSGSGGHDGSASNVTANCFVPDAPGVDYASKTAMRFATGKYVSIGDYYDLAGSTTKVAASIWFKTTHHSATPQTFFSKGFTTLHETGYQAWMTSTGDNDYFYFQVKAYLGEESVYYRTVRAPAFPIGTYTDGQWHNFVVHYQHDSATTFTVRMFFDGQEVTVSEITSQDFTYADYGASDNFQIGRRGSGDYYFFGELKEFYLMTGTTLPSANTMGKEFFGGGIPPENLYPCYGDCYQYMRLGEDDTHPTVLSRGAVYVRNGTMSGTAATDLVPDDTNYKFPYWSLDFDGSDDLVTMGNVLDKEYTDAFSLVLFAKVACNPNRVIMAKREGSGDYKGFSFGLDSSSSAINVSLSNDVSPAYYIHKQFTCTASSDWHHFVMTYSGNGAASGLKCYVNGVELSGSTLADTLGGRSISNSSDLLLGAEGSAASPINLIEGNITHAGLFGVELTATEVREALFFPNLEEHSQAANLQGFWRAGNDDTYPTITDYGTGGNDGTMTNMAAGDISYEHPKIPYLSASMTFDGTEHRIVVGDFFDYDYDDSFSVSFWAKTSSDAVQRIISKQAETTYCGLDIYLNGGSNLVETDFMNTVTTDGIAKAHTYATADDGNWHHYVVTYNGGGDADDLDLYVDGVLITDVSEGQDNLTATTLNSTNLQFGARTFSPERFFSGNLAHVLFFNDNLTLSQVQELYGWGAPLDPKAHSETAADGLQAEWKLGTGDTYPTATESVGGVNGTMTNMAASDIDLYDAPIALGDL